MKNKLDFVEKENIEIVFSNSNHTFPLHSHESFCYGIVTSGGVFFEIDGERKLLTRGMSYIIPSNHGVIIESAPTYRYIAICIKNHAKDRLNQYNYTDHYPEYISCSTIETLCDQFKNTGDEEALVSELIHLLAPVTALEIRDPSYDEELITSAKQYIRDHVNERFQLEELAAHVHVSKYYLIRLFKSAVGVTPNQYYIQAKLSKAKEGLQMGFSPTEVATELNFNDQSYMCRQFKRLMGISVTDYLDHYHKI